MRKSLQINTTVLQTAEDGLKQHCLEACLFKMPVGRKGLGDLFITHNQK